MIYLPLTNDPASRVTVNTGDGTYIFATYFMPSGVWMMDILDTSGVMILSGIALVPGCDNLLKGHGELFKNDRMIVVSDTASLNNTADSLGNTAQVVWFNSSETNPLIYDDPLLVD